MRGENAQMTERWREMLVYNRYEVWAVPKKVVLTLPDVVSTALGASDEELSSELLKGLLLSLYMQGRLTLEDVFKVLERTGLTAGEFAALVVSLKPPVGGSDAEKRESLLAELQEWGRIARETGLTPEEVDEEVRAVRDARGG